MSSKYNRPSISSLDGRSMELEDPENYLRKRIHQREPSLDDDDSLEAGDLSDGLSEDEDAPGCPLPSTPEDNELLEAEVSQVYTNFVIKMSQKFLSLQTSIFLAYHCSHSLLFLINCSIDDGSIKGWRLIR